MACTNPYLYTQQDPPSHTNSAWFQKTPLPDAESSSIVLHRVLCYRLLGNCLLLRSSRSSIGIGDAYRIAMECLEITSAGQY